MSPRPFSFTSGTLARNPRNLAPTSTTRMIDRRPPRCALRCTVTISSWTLWRIAVLAISLAIADPVEHEFVRIMDKSRLIMKNTRERERERPKIVRRNLMEDTASRTLCTQSFLDTVKYTFTELCGAVPVIGERGARSPDARASPGCGRTAIDVRPFLQSRFSVVRASISRCFVFCCP